MCLTARLRRRFRQRIHNEEELNVEVIGQGESDLSAGKYHVALNGGADR